MANKLEELAGKALEDSLTGRRWVGVPALEKLVAELGSNHLQNQEATADTESAPETFGSEEDAGWPSWGNYRILLPEIDTVVYFKRKPTLGETRAFARAGHLNPDTVHVEERD